MTFNLATDVKIEVELPPSTGFVLGVSKLGTDVLSVTAPSWVDISATIASLEISQGPQLMSGIYTQVQPGMVEAVFQSETYDPNFNARMRSGTPIRISYLQGGTWHWLFRGKIETLQTTYNYDGSNVVSMTAVDELKNLLNQSLPGFSFPVPQYTGTRLYDIAVAADYPYAADIDFEAGVAKMSELSGDYDAGTLINELVKCELGMLWYDYTDDCIKFRDRYWVAGLLIGGAYYEFSDVHSTADYHVCYSDVVIGTDTDKLTNHVLVSYSQGSGAWLARGNSDSIQLYGMQSQRIWLDLDHTDNDELISWAEAAVDRPLQQSVQNLTFKAVNRVGELFEATNITIGDCVNVHKTIGANTIDEDFVVTNVRHSINTDVWTTTLELWKGL